MSLATAMTAHSRLSRLHRLSGSRRPSTVQRARGVLSLLGTRRAARGPALSLLLVNILLLAGQGGGPLLCEWPAGAGLLAALVQAAPCSEPSLRTPPIAPDTVAALAQREPLTEGCQRAFRKSDPQFGDPLKAATACRMAGAGGRWAGQSMALLQTRAGLDLHPTCHQSNRPPPHDLS